MILVYVAGPYSGSILEVAHNIRIGRSAAVELMRIGFSVICPWNDWELAVLADLPMEIWKEAGMEQLRHCDAILILPGWEKSPGTIAEIAEARRRNIPIFFTIEDLQTFAKTG